MLGSDDGVASCRSEFVGLAQEFVDLPESSVMVES